MVFPLIGGRTPSQLQGFTEGIELAVPVERDFPPNLFTAQSSDRSGALVAEAVFPLKMLGSFDCVRTAQAIPLGIHQAELGDLAKDRT